MQQEWDSPSFEAGDEEKKTSQLGLCILDFSGTLIANGNIAPQAKQAVHTCVESGQKIGVVSSSDNVEFLRKTLQSIDGQVFLKTPVWQ